MRRIVFLGVLLSLLVGPARAQEVQIGDQLLFRVTNARPAGAINPRLEKLLLSGANPAELKLVQVKGGIGIYWGKLEIVVVTKELAAANSSQPKALAEQWLNRLREVAQVGLLKLSPSRLEIPIDGEATVEVSGLADGAFFFEETTGRVQLFEESPTRLRVKARSVGKTRLVVQRGKARASLFVHVKDWAGKVPEQVGVEVCGTPAPGELVTEAILRAWAASKNPRLQQAFMEIAYGKTPSAVEVSGKDGEALRVVMTWGDGDAEES